MRKFDPEKPVGTVLIIDDDPLFRMILEQVFRANGIGEVLVAQDGAIAAGILAARPNEVDAITLDLSMPNLDGVAFLRHAKAAGYKGSLLLISGEHKTVLASAERLASMNGLNCIGTVPKPVDYNLIVQKIMQGSPSERRSNPRPPVDIDRLNASLLASRLTAYYQPRTFVKTGRLSGAEALARMWDENGTLMDAGEMINLAEKHGRITDITWRIIEIVIEDCRQLARQGLGGLDFSFNISASILDNGQFPDQLAEKVRLSGLQPSSFILELTESIIPHNTAASLEALTRLRMAGFKLAIDDFGTGLSNIDQLAMYPFTELKIDKSFMQAASTDAFSRACVETSVALARELDLSVVAEGVETPEELELARLHAIDEVQGYLFGKPMPFADFLSYAKAGAGRAARSPLEALLAS